MPLVSLVQSDEIKIIYQKKSVYCQHRWYIHHTTIENRCIWPAIVSFASLRRTECYGIKSINEQKVTIRQNKKTKEKLLALDTHNPQTIENNPCDLTLLFFYITAKNRMLLNQIIIKLNDTMSRNQFNWTRLRPKI